MIWTGYEPVVFRCVCATCQAVIREGTPGALVSHGQCQGCHDEQMAELDRLLPTAAA